MLLLISVAVAIGIADKSRREKVDLHVKQGAIHYGSGAWKKAEQAYEAALKLDPDNSDCLYNLAIAKKQIYTQDGNARALDEGIALLERALKINDDHVGLLNLQGTFLRMRGKLTEAAAVHQHVAELDSTYFANWVNYGSVLAMQGDIAKAEEYLKEAVSLPGGIDSVMAWHNLLAVQLVQAKPETLETLETLEALLRASGKASVPAYVLKAKVYLQLPRAIDIQEALELAGFASRLPVAEAGSARVQSVLALARLRKGRWAEAADAAAAAIDEGGGLQSMPHLILAVAEARLGKKAPARQHLETALSHWPPEFEETGFIATADAGWLWFDTDAELRELRTEAEAATAPRSQPD